MGDPERAGRALVTMLIEDLDALRAGFAARGVEAGPVEEITPTTFKVDVVDPDGNRLQFAQVPSDE